MRAFISCLFSVLFISSLHAQEFYKWIDTDGVTHYSEVLPSQEVEYYVLEIPVQYATNKPSDDYYSIQNQLKRIQEQRLLWRELHSPVKQKEEVVVEEVYVEPEVVRYAPVYPYHYKYPYFKNKHYNHNKKYNKHKKYKYGKKYKKYKYGKHSRRHYSYPKSYKRNSGLVVKID